MGWNPLNWKITDTIQGQEGGFDLNPFNQTPRSFLAVPQSSSTPEVGSTYYDFTSGQWMQYSNGSWTPFNATGQSSAYDGATLGASTGGSRAPSYNPQELQMLDEQKSLYERLLGSVDSAEQSGMQKLQDSETTARNNANQQRSRALENFGVQREDMTRGKDQKLQEVGDNSRMLWTSLMRKLGLGAGGGSAFQMSDKAVARDASKNRQSVLGAYGANERDLALSERRANEDYEALLNEITNDRRAKEESFKAGIYGQRQGVNQSLAQIAADRAGLVGGNQLQAAAPYRNNYLSLQGQIDQLPNQYRTDVQARNLNVQTPTLRDYVVDRAAINQNRQSGQQQYSPYAQFLNRDKDEELQVR